MSAQRALFVYDDASSQFVRPLDQCQKKENGDRAVGTQLTADHPAQALLRRGEAYQGPAVLFGKSFMTSYFRFPSGRKVIASSCRNPTAQLDAMFAEVDARP